MLLMLSIEQQTNIINIEMFNCLICRRREIMVLRVFETCLNSGIPDLHTLREVPVPKEETTYGPSSVR